MTNKQWHPDDLQKVFPEIPESCSRALMDTAGLLKEESDMRRYDAARRLPRFALVLALVVSMAGVALAAFYPQITAVFGRHYGTKTQVWLEKGDIALPADAVRIAGVTFTLDEVVYRNHGLYGLGTIVPDEGIVLLSEESAITDAYGYAVRYGEEAPAGAPSIMEKATQSGSVLKQVGIGLEKLGVDGGALTVPDGWGGGLYPQRDGSIQFVFEVEDGNAIADGERYTIQMAAVVRDVTSDGAAEPIRREWTVEIAPRPFGEVVGAPAPAAQAPAPIPATAAGEGTNEMRIIAPEAYAENGTLPVYKAVARELGKGIDYAWFDRSGVSKEQTSVDGACGTVDLSDGGHLDWSSDAIFYITYDGTYEAVGHFADGGSYTETLPKQAMVSDVGTIAMWMAQGFPGTGEVYTLESAQLETISLSEAQAQAEALMAKLGMSGYTCTTALDMGVDRIHEMGALYNAAIDSGRLMTNAFRHDYAAATTDEEGYYLVYHKFGHDGNLARQFEAALYVTADGVKVMALRDAYELGEVVSTPAALVDAQTVAAALPAKIADSRFAEEIKRIERATLTWMPVQADQGDGMVLTPVWVLCYITADGQRQGHEGWAVFDAVNGALIDAIFN